MGAAGALCSVAQLSLAQQSARSACTKQARPVHQLGHLQKQMGWAPRFNACPALVMALHFGSRPFNFMNLAPE